MLQAVLLLGGGTVAGGGVGVDGGGGIGVPYTSLAARCRKSAEF